MLNIGQVGRNFCEQGVVSPVLPEMCDDEGQERNRGDHLQKWWEWKLLSQVGLW